MPQGVRRSNDIDLSDSTYDGNSTEDYRLYGGLGQLTDGVEGQSNFRLDPLGRGIRGYEWVGWKNDSFSVERPLEIIFRYNVKHVLT
jgi:discoidin domain receptor family protein 2